MNPPRAGWWWVIGGFVLFAVGLTIRLVLVASRPEPPDAYTPPTTLTSPPPSQVRAEPRQVLDRVLESVVAVGNGSGFVFDDDGHVLTSAAGASARTVTLRDGSQVPATLVGTDPAAGVAVLRIADAPAPLTLGGPVVVGDAVVAAGAPRGSVTTGIVSALDRQVDGVTVLQTDAAVSTGNAGGPLVDGAGAVVGVNTAGPVAGLGFAVPADVVAEAAKRIIG